MAGSIQGMVASRAVAAYSAAPHAGSEGQGPGVRPPVSSRMYGCVYLPVT